MTYDPARQASIGVHRIQPFTGEDVGDKTAGGAANLQQYLDARRHFLGNVVDIPARNALTGLQAGDFVLVESVPQIDMWNGSAWTTVSGTGGGGSGAPAYSVVTVTTTPYTATTLNDVVVTNRATAGPFTVNLPASPANGNQIRIKDGKGDANTNFITIVATGGKTIDGAATLVLDESFGARTLIYGDTTDWRVV